MNSFSWYQKLKKPFWTPVSKIKTGYYTLKLVKLINGRKFLFGFLLSKTLSLSN